ncbi:MAG: helix-turn-helix transcriptional regulator, partial [Smithellaceae bacterium]
REASGMTLKDVYAVTRISVVNLEAIENGAFEDLPVPTYTKNFIKTYARALGMDSRPILDRVTKLI